MKIRDCVKEANLFNFCRGNLCRNCRQCIQDRQELWYWVLLSNKRTYISWSWWSTCAFLVYSLYLVFLVEETVCNFWYACEFSKIRSSMLFHLIFESLLPQISHPLKYKNHLCFNFFSVQVVVLQISYESLAKTPQNITVESIVRTKF